MRPCQKKRGRALRVQLQAGRGQQLAGFKSRGLIMDGACNNEFIHAGQDCEFRKRLVYGIRRTHERASEKSIDLLLYVRRQWFDVINGRRASASVGAQITLTPAMA
jgi:hypothetical protein